MILSGDNLKNIDSSLFNIPEAAVMELPEKVLQFGTGVLLRGLPDFFIDKANKQGIFNGRIVVVKSTSKGSTAEFDEQDSLYTLCVRGITAGEEVKENIISGAISRVLAAETHWEAILDFAAGPDFQIILSNTTEVGIQLVEESITGVVPQSFPAKVLAVLYHRFKSEVVDLEKPIVIVATELIPDNGTKLKNVVSDLVKFNNLESGFVNWVNDKVIFCNSLVDRIVPGKPDTKMAAVLESELGYTDNLLSMAEPYRLWAIEGDHRVAEILSFIQADAGAIVKPDIEIYRELKVRLLNGTHTLSCGVAMLAGIDTVRNAMINPDLEQYIAGVMMSEIVPAIPYDVNEDEAIAFSKSVLDRFANPFIEHLWINITMQYSMKLKIRILPVLLNYYDKFNTAPEHIAFGFAAFLMFMKSDHEKDGLYLRTVNGTSIPINDDSAAWFYKHGQNNDGAGYVAAVLQDKDYWATDLSELTGFIDVVAEHYNAIEVEGVVSALARLERTKINS
ncbi:MAG: tagaturonate reductase [Pedobacter sp.]|nr:MAG: tagaturonate reductase [Pedobacter sp.]